MNKTKIYFNIELNEIYLIEYVKRSGGDDTIFLEHDTYSYVLMNRSVLDRLDTIIEIGEL